MKSKSLRDCHLGLYAIPVFWGASILLSLSRLCSDMKNQDGGKSNSAFNATTQKNKGLWTVKFAPSFPFFKMSDGLLARVAHDRSLNISTNSVPVDICEQNKPNSTILLF